MLTIKRYLNRELLKTTCSITLILCMVFLCNQLIRLLGRVVAGKVSSATLLKLLAVQFPYLLGLLLPIGLYLGILLVFSRLYVDHEITVLQACGVSQWQIFGMILPTSLGIMGLVALLLSSINPQLLTLQTQLLQASPTQFMVDTLMPGRFYIAHEGRQVYYVEGLDHAAETAKWIFIAKQEQNYLRDRHTAPTWSVMSAKTGQQYQDAQGNDYILAQNGFRYVGQAGQAKFQWVQFLTLASFLEANLSPPPLQNFAQASMSNTSLWQNYPTDLQAMAELQWRIAIPLSVPILALVALGLSHVKPRQGRYSSLMPAILLYIVFANGMFISRSWLESERLPPSLGLWGILGITLGIGIVLQCPWQRWLQQQCRALLKVIS